MYEQLLENAGYDVTTKLVDSRDGYMADFPGGVDIVPEYVGGIVNFLNSAKNGENAAPFEAGDGDQLVSDGQPLLDEAGITLLDLSAATDTNAFMVTQDYSDETPSPSCPTSRASASSSPPPPTARAGSTARAA